MTSANEQGKSAADIDNILSDEDEGDDEDSDGFSIASADIDDAFFVDEPPKKPDWQTVNPIYSLPPPGRNDASRDGPGYDTVQIYLDVPIFNAKDRGNANPWIRMLQIKPDVFGEKIHCKLVRWPLFDGREYYALSYSWASDQEDRMIFVETQRNPPSPFRVTVNLFNALQRLRDERHAVHVCVDAVCIYQRWDLEREAQVNIMAQIYNQASEVRVWLGEPGDLESTAKTDGALFNSLCRQPNPWWTRLWVVQECAYAEQCPLVMIGDEVMSFARLIERWESAIEQEYATKDVLSANLPDLRLPFTVWSSQKAGNTHRLPLSRRLRDVAGRQCSEPHDRIYALLNLIDEIEASQLRPNYATPFPDLVHDVMKVMRASPNWDEVRDEDLEYLLDSRQWVVTIFAENRPTREYWAALIPALQDGDPDFLEALMPKCTYVGARKEDIDGAFYVACKGGSAEIVESFIKQGADVNARDPYSLKQVPDTALRAAFMGGHRRVVKTLLRSGAGVKGVMKRPYDLPTDSYEPEVDALIESGVTLTAAGRHLSSSLLDALRFDRKHVTRILIAAGARVDKEDIDRHALRVPLVRGYNDVVEMFVEADWDVTTGTQPRFHTYALDEALLIGNRDVAKWLIRTGLAESNSARFGHSWVLLRAATNGFSDIAKMMIEAGADINDAEGRYSPPLLAASNLGAVDIVKMLLDAGANVNAWKEGEDTPLHLASAQGFADVVSVLLAAGADVHARGCGKRTALDVASEEDHKEVVQMLIDAGEGDAGNIEGREDQDTRRPRLMTSAGGGGGMLKRLGKAGARINAWVREREKEMRGSRTER